MPFCPHSCRPPHQQAHDPHCIAAKFRSEPFYDLECLSRSDQSIVRMIVIDGPNRLLSGTNLPCSMT